MTDEPGFFPKELSMARAASLLVLLAIIGVLGFVFIRVMASFWLPLFLAALLVVIFRPLHQWILDACEGKQKRSAILTTLAILLAVLGPLVWVGFVAFDETKALLQRDWSEVLPADVQGESDSPAPLNRIRAKLNLDMPYAEPIRELDAIFKELEQVHTPVDDERLTVKPGNCEELVGQAKKTLWTLRDQVMDKLIQTLAEKGDLPVNDEFVTITYQELMGRRAKPHEVKQFKADDDSNKHKKLVDRLSGKEADLIKESIDSPADDAEFARMVFTRLTGGSAEGVPLEQFITDSPNWREAMIDHFNPSQFHRLISDVERSHRPIFDELEQRRKVQQGGGAVDSTEELELTLTKARECKLHLDKASLGYRHLKGGLLGGPFWSGLRSLANPTTDQLQDWQGKALGYFQQNVVSLTGQTTAIVGSFAFGLFVLIIALYYFLIDGPKLIRAAMRLSPLDNKYEQELFAEFGNVSRAVVLATLLSAVVQALLAGAGYWAVGAKPLFLLTLVTGLLAMVPFVGAAAVWLPVSLWVMFAQPGEMAGEVGRLIPGICLAVYGAVIVSMADNLIKPWVLAGQSNLHPLLGLLSVLGGVKTLGPIGLLIGPMVVSFLQALLNMLNAELGEKTSVAVEDDKADVVVVRRKPAPAS